MKRPIYDSLRQIAGRGYQSWHMPGHKGGQLFSLDQLYALDVTELEETDNLQRPVGIIREAEQRMSAFFGAEESFFSVNGSTGGILAAIAAVCRPGDRIIACRNAHKSFFNACIHVGVQPIYVQPEIIEPFGIPGGVLPEQVKTILQNNPEVKGMYLTSPTFEGVVTDIAEIAELLHEQNKVLLVDEAHGAHFCCIPGFPKSALSMGADIVVQSLHKTLPSPTQTAMVHIQGSRISQDRMRLALNAFQSTSPSYIFLAAMDYCRAFLEGQPKEFFQSYRDMLMEYREKLQRVPSFILLEKREQRWDLDPAKIVLHSRAKVSGPALAHCLRKDYGIELEGAFGGNLVGISTIADSRESFQQFYQGIRALDSRIQSGDKTLFEKSGNFNKKEFENNQNYDIIELPKVSRTLRDAFYRPYEAGSLAQARGRVSAAFVTPYPPGIPIVCPGEFLSERELSMIQEALGRGEDVLGMEGQGEILVLSEY